MKLVGIRYHISIDFKTTVRCSLNLRQPLPPQTQNKRKNERKKKRTHAHIHSLPLSHPLKQKDLHKTKNSLYYKEAKGQDNKDTDRNIEMDPFNL